MVQQPESMNYFDISILSAPIRINISKAYTHRVISHKRLPNVVTQFHITYYQTL